VTKQGLYVAGRSPLHHWHPLTKLSLTGSAVLLAFTPWHHRVEWLVFPLVVLLLYLALLALGGTSLITTWSRRLLLILGPILVSLVLVHGFFFPAGETPLLLLGPFTLTHEGLLFAVTIGGRLLIMVGAFLLLLTTTYVADLTLALTQRGMRHELAYMLLAALLLLPRMQARGSIILMSQQARGLAVTGNPLRRARALLPLLGPLLLSALNDAESRAIALEARAFRAPVHKTSLRELADSTRQRFLRWALLVSSALVLAGTQLWMRSL
jgi:energy-coupling factor transport system permease protein